MAWQVRQLLWRQTGQRKTLTLSASTTAQPGQSAVWQWNVLAIAFSASRIERSKCFSYNLAPTNFLPPKFKKNQNSKLQNEFKLNQF
jgi:tRNA U38,U39,U40 pseudouridine synthase TruA